MVEEFRRILIPTDGSEYTMLAARKGVGLARLLGAKVTAIYVVDEGAFSAIPPDSLVTDVLNILEGEGLRAVGQVREIGEEIGVDVETRIVRGTPAREIVEAAEDHDLIVMGTLGRTGLSHFLLGSVAEAVMRQAPCPVMLIRAPKESE